MKFISSAHLSKLTYSLGSVMQQLITVDTKKMRHYTYRIGTNIKVNINIENLRKRSLLLFLQSHLKLTGSLNPRFLLMLDITCN